MRGRSPTLHANALRLGRHGVLIRGGSGAGKSVLTLALLEHEAELGRSAALVADDRVIIERTGDALIARVPETIAGLIELRGVGILKWPSEPECTLSLVVDLGPASAMPRMPEPAESRTEIEGIALARLQLAAMGEGMDLAVAALTVRTMLRHLDPPV
ncbi:HPr kinase/phosphorylase [Hartmannibacter diazotrophicus]|uniref:HPr kinase/phosphorylase n=1 Tax=Hartmannibacter diazotrophicus TaxID=1482074 RepID=A0A2C9DDZ3_9HYPH|nr:HPr kinase/phosphatase C-terminal domain-containing protein [Hartmannibacter diazotrophicus]SON58390.1 HPr kinase/phosphorylase [Hartmannibacter diazotrophicus]